MAASNCIAERITPTAARNNIKATAKCQVAVLRNSWSTQKAIIKSLKQMSSKAVKTSRNGKKNDGGPFPGLGPPSLALSPSACFAMEFQFCWHIWIKEIIAASLGSFSSSDLVNLSLCKCLVNLDLLEKPCTTEPEGSEPLWVVLRIETN